MSALFSSPRGNPLGLGLSLEKRVDSVKRKTAVTMESGTNVPSVISPLGHWVAIRCSAFFIFDSQLFQGFFFNAGYIAPLVL